MTTVLLLAAAYGSPGMSFPWWVWLLAVMADEAPVAVRELRRRNGA